LLKGLRERRGGQGRGPSSSSSRFHNRALGEGIKEGKNRGYLEGESLLKNPRDSGWKPTPLASLGTKAMEPGGNRLSKGATKGNLLVESNKILNRLLSSFQTWARGLGGDSPMGSKNCELRKLFVVKPLKMRGLIQSERIQHCNRRYGTSGERYW